jgi:hypothetical protein
LHDERQAAGSPDTFCIEVDSLVPLADAILAGGYDRYDPYLLKHFGSHPRTSEMAHVTLVHFRTPMPDEAVFAELDRRKLLPATFAHLLAFGAQCDDARRGFEKVAMGSSNTDGLGRSSYPVLMEWPRARQLLISWDRPSGWTAEIRFLAVCCKE